MSIDKTTANIIFNLNQVHDYIALLRDTSLEEEHENGLIDTVLEAKTQLRDLQEMLSLAYDCIYYLTWLFRGQDLVKQGRDPGQSLDTIRGIAEDKYLKFMKLYQEKNDAPS